MTQNSKLPECPIYLRMQENKRGLRIRIKQIDYCSDMITSLPFRATPTLIVRLRTVVSTVKKSAYMAL